MTRIMSPAVAVQVVNDTLEQLRLVKPWHERTASSAFGFKYCVIFVFGLSLSLYVVSQREITNRETAINKKVET